MLRFGKGLRAASFSLRDGNCPTAIPQVPEPLGHSVEERGENDRQAAGTRSHLHGGNSRTADGTGAVALFLPSMISRQSWGP